MRLSTANVSAVVLLLLSCLASGASLAESHVSEAASRPLPGDLSTAASNSHGLDLEAAFGPTQGSTDYRVRIDLAHAADVRTARALGMATAVAGVAEYRLSEQVFQALLQSGLSFDLLGGITTYRFMPAGTEPGDPVADSLTREQDSTAPGIHAATGSFYISSGSVNDAIPDQGWAWRWLQVGGGAAAPAGSTTTNLKYRLRIHNDSDPGNIYCGDYEIYLSSEARGGAIPHWIVYDNLGGATDGGYDDDTADDSDIYLNLRQTSHFNGEDPNQKWYVYIIDSFAQDVGFLQYIEFEVFWQGPAIDLAASDILLRDQPENGGSVVDTPVAGQQLYPHLYYTVSSPTDLTGKIWQIDLPLTGTTLCSLTTTEPPGSRVGWCLSPWTVPAGLHNLRGELDPDDVFDETNEGNNEAFHNYTVCAQDGFEPDDSSGQASGITPGVPQAHSICPVGDEDWAVFTLAAASEIVLETAGPSGDTRMWLYDNGLSQVEYDDDDGTGTFSRIDRQCGVDELAAGTYYVKVDEFGDNGVIGDYSLTLTAAPCGGPPEIRIEPLTLTFNQATREPIYVEIDWMDLAGDHSHRPSASVINEIEATFASAGYEIHIDVSNAIPHDNVVDVLSSPSSSPEIQALMATHFDHSGDSRYYYSLWLHQYSRFGTLTTSSGIADLPGRVHLVTLGAFSDNIGTFSNQVGTFVHEFGHNLNQKHGGADHSNWKPNYLSIMNYHYQLGGIGPTLLAKGLANTASGFEDYGYSHGLLPTLNESALDENDGIGLGRAVDWDCDGSTEASVATDIQASNWCSASGGQSVISDFDNWIDVAPEIQTGNDMERSRAVRSKSCMTWEQYQPLHERLEALRAAGTLPPDGPRARPMDPSRDPAIGQYFTVFNDGGGPLTVSSLALDTATSWISWEPQAPFVVPPGGTQRVHVYVDRGGAPAGQTNRRLLVGSDDSDENPYPGGVFLVIHADGNGCADGYEPDDSSGQASILTPGSPQSHSICPVGDEDWARFSLSSPSYVLLETSGPSGDTRMWLYDSGLSQIEYDDDDGSGTFSRIDRQCGVDELLAGTYYLQIDEYADNAEIPSYQLDLTAAACLPPCQAHLVMQNETVGGGQYRALQTITAGPAVIIDGTAAPVEFVAGQSIQLGDDVEIMGTFSAEIAPVPCP